MAFSPADSDIFAPLLGDPELAAVFSDAQFVRNLLRVEGALARAQGTLGVIPGRAADKIVAACETLNVDFEQLRRGVQQDGVPIVALVKQIEARVGNGDASYVHWGATTQDIMDTALVLQMGAALAHLEKRLQQTIRALGSLAARNRHIVMAGRTHSQQALPITFGFKVATWIAPLLRDTQRLNELKSRGLVVQFGGAVGTLAALGNCGIAVQNELARELGLAVPMMPWHTQRDGLAEIANWLSLVSGGLGKMAQDILLLAQTEVGEVYESEDATRGGSSTMPQKRNPIFSELVVAAARANASLLSNMHHAMIQEHERATHGWQLEWLTLPQMFVNTGAALHHALFLSEHLVVNETRMAENVRASQGLMLAEPITFALAEHMPRTKAKGLAAQACQIALTSNQHLVDVMRGLTDAPLDWDALRDESRYLGESDALLERILEQAHRMGH